jgi:nucleoid-associated protein YgaU
MGFGLKKLTGKVFGTVAGILGQKPEQAQAEAAPIQAAQAPAKPEEAKKKPRANNMGTILAGEAAGPTASVLEKKTILGG